MALAYGQVNASSFGCVSGDQSSSGGRLKTGRQVCSSSNAPQQGHGQRRKDSANRNDETRAALSTHSLMTQKPPHPSHKPTPKAFASRLAPLRNNFSVFATTPCRGLP